MIHSKIFQVSPNTPNHSSKEVHYVNADTQEQAIAVGKEVWPTQNIESAIDFTEKFTEKEKENLPDHVRVYANYQDFL